jgi:predicted ATPase
MEAAAAHRYQEPVFVAPPWKEIYTTDEMRRATFAQAESFYEKVISAYDKLGYELIELPRSSVEERVALIMAHLA